MQVWEVWNAAIGRANRLGPEALDPVERTIYRANKWLIEVDMGGVTGALYNLSPEQGRWTELHETAAALAAIGDSVGAELLEAVANLLDSAGAGADTHWDEFIEGVSPRLAPDGDLVLGLRRCVPAGWKHLEAYTLRQCTGG